MTETEATMVVELVVVAVRTSAVVVVVVVVADGVGAMLSKGLAVSICKASAREVLALLPSASVAEPVTDHVPSSSLGKTHPVRVGDAMY